MSDSNNLFYSQNLVYVEHLYQQFLTDPEAVDPEWADYFRAQEGSSGDLRPQHLRPPAATAAQAKAPVYLDGTDTKDYNFLRTVPIFRDISQEELSFLVKITDRVVFDVGQVICQHGQEVNDLFVVVDGVIQVIREGDPVGEIGVGEIIGELAVFDSRPRSADFIVKTKATLLQVRRTKLTQLLEKRPTLAMGLLHGLASRLRVASAKQESVDRLIRAYRVRGHVKSQLDPLHRARGIHTELTMDHYNLHDEDLHTKFTANFGESFVNWSLEEIIGFLEKTYCRAIGAQFMHIDDLVISDWIRKRMERDASQFALSREEQLRILRKLTDAEVFESFLHRKFVGAKRFSLEGGESLIPLLDYAIEEAGNHGVEEVIIGMAHRGRLNVLVNLFKKPALQVFHEFKETHAEAQMGRGDVKYHLGYSSSHTTLNGKEVHLSLCFNPSHLEFVGPVAMGRVRAKQDRFGDTKHSRALPMIIHGDAAFAGQGVVQEMLNLSELPGYSSGGTVHIILNNQIGFTTDPGDSRSCQYSTDVARMLQIPIFHVNGENPEAVARVIRMAMDFRTQFKKDVVIDMYCYRKYGHNEGDDPSFTQPVMYAEIKKRESVRSAYVKNLLTLNEVTQEEADVIAEESRKRLEEDHKKAQNLDVLPEKSPPGAASIWSSYQGGPDTKVPDVETAVDLDTLKSILEKISSYPDWFNPHRKIQKFLEAQKEMADGDKPLPWGAGEALAFATLLNEKVPVRITGQDSERGTFSHRHAVLHDHKSGQRYTPLANISENQAPLHIYNSPLSEIGVLGFEYGYSLDFPDALVIWEAQFGDFSNVAQVIIDQFLTSSEDKWQRLSGLCLFLPHGFEGQGPEHSSARLERYLMLCATDNIQVVNLTTPAQLFHCLRRQVHRTIRKPLVVMSPKSLLRHPQAVSDLSEFANGRFHKILADDPGIDKQKVNKILLCSGKIYYELLEKRNELGAEDHAIVRMEQYYPLPLEELKMVLGQYPSQTPVVWVQEEPLNMGAWPFLYLHYEHSLEGNGSHPLTRVTREEASSPATGYAAFHRREQAALLERAFKS